MSIRGVVRFGLSGTVLVGALVTAGSCYRAEIDLKPLLDDESPAGGGVLTSAAGEAGSGGSAETAAGGAAGAPSCLPAVEDPVQYQCRLRLPSAQVCDVQDSPGWAGCYNGGCSICNEVLVDYPYYLVRHPCCMPNGTCSVHKPLKCSALCPPPTELDQVAPCLDLER